MARQCNTHIAGEDQEGGNQARRHTDPSAVLEAASVTACAPADNPQALWPVEKRAHFNGREGVTYYRAQEFYYPYDFLIRL